MTTNRNYIYKDTEFVVPSVLKGSIQSISIKGKYLIIKLRPKFQNIEIKTDVTSGWNQLKERIKNKLEDYKINDIDIVDGIFEFLGVNQDKILDKSIENGNIENKREQYKCSLANCNNSVEYHLICIYAHKIMSACDSCKKDLDKMAIAGLEDASIRNNHKELKIKNIKFNKHEENGTYTIEIHGQPTDEIDLPGLEWIQIYD
jgi:hypothetical protein